MRITPLPEFQSQAILTATDFTLIDDALRRQAHLQGLDLHHGHGRSVWCQLDSGEFGAKKRGDNVLVFARAHRADGLARLQEAMQQLVAAALPGPAPTISWSSAADEGRMPANFSLAQVQDVRRLSPDFARLRLVGPQLARLAHDDSMHFRLVLPAPGDRQPEWPRMAANGQTLWPAGDKALHRPVYTVRAIDPQAGWLETDIFLHPGGRVSDWVQDLIASGDRTPTVGLAGPSGGGVPQARQLILAGDATAYPAMARIMSARPDAVGQIWLLGPRCDYAFPDHAGIRVAQLPGGADELALILRENPPAAATYIWMATERAQVEQLRRLILDQLGHDKHLTHLAAYWTA